jgi:SAM-dependent methyltransferase
LGALYDPEFFDAIREGSGRSAGGVVPILQRCFAPRSVVDVGCGEGAWCDAFLRHGAQRVVGLDWLPGYELGRTIRTRSGAEITMVDLEEALGPPRATFDLALCLEVAEHLSPGRADSLVRDLCSLAPVVVFSAAVPGQGGQGHVNEQWPREWAQRFLKQDRLVTGRLRDVFADDGDIEPWYRHNMIVAVAQGSSLSALATLLPPGASRLHPALWVDGDGDMAITQAVHALAREMRAATSPPGATGSR